MKRLLLTTLALLAAAAVLPAINAPFASIPLVGSVRLAETPITSAAQLWTAAGAILAAAALLWTRLPRAASIAVAALTGVLVIVIDVRAWQWRTEKLNALRELEIERLADAIQYKGGLYGLIALTIFVLAFFGALLYPGASSKNPHSLT